LSMDEACPKDLRVYAAELERKYVPEGK
jgi:hypothetical protein